VRWSSGIALVLACREPAPQVPPPRACSALARACDPAVTDATALTIVRHSCVPCHAVNGIARHDFVDDAPALAHAPLVDRIASCEMPPDGAPTLSDPDRRVLVAWGICHR
jgi:hypothetical protein